MESSKQFSRPPPPWMVLTEGKECLLEKKDESITFGNFTWKTMDYVNEGEQDAGSLELWLWTDGMAS